MIQHLLNVLAGWGLGGLLIVMAIEGSSLPFPGIVVVLAFGYVLSPTFPELLAFAALMSLAYSLASYIPYGIGFRLDTMIPKRFSQKLHKAQQMFRQYGLWSIALSRPFGAGNYISYVAGICQVGALKYGVLTFLGIFPWAAVTLFLGYVFKGSGAAVVSFFAQYQGYIWVVLFMVILACVAVLYVRLRSTGERGGSGS